MVLFEHVAAVCVVFFLCSLSLFLSDFLFLFLFFETHFLHFPPFKSSLIFEKFLSCSEIFKMNGLSLLAVCLFLSLLFIAPSTCGPVVGIDMGTMWYKVAMIHGQHMDLVLDVAGDRKRNTWVGIKGEDRVFGRDAETMVSKRDFQKEREREEVEEKKRENCSFA